ncbi:hypothetical protein DYB32_005014 [Aphanomyces invadans]|uniref:C2 domain-containing protein n=1 Tax=Aphanomyces invadans TaxID=157072 RepID=A0A3R6ZQ76_9STRA|nr:hypothetical protein DYB32_005014 [Aphanomyces invadans]
MNCTNVCRMRSSAPVGRTETIHNVPNPSFLQSFKVDAPLGGEILKIEVYDEEKSSSKSLKDQDLLGIVEVPVKQLVDNLAQITTLRTSGGGARGLFKKEQPPLNVYVQTELMNPTSDVLVMQWSAKDLTNLDGMFNKSDPYCPPSASVIDGNLNPVWQQATVTLQRLANGDLDRPLLAQVFDMDNGEKKRELIGQVQTSARALLELPTLFLLSASGKPAGSLRPLHMLDWLVKVHSQDGGQDTTVVFINSTSRAVDIVWVAYEGDEHFYNRIEPGHRYEQPTISQHSWKIAFSDTQEPLAYFLAPLTNSVVDIHGVNQIVIGANLQPMQPGDLSDSIPTVLVFANCTPGVLSIRWVDSDQTETQYAVLQPGESYRQDTYSNHVWKATYIASDTALAFVSAPREPTHVDVCGFNQLRLTRL